MTGADSAKRARSAHGVYGISVASELSGIPPQTLRLYERFGLVTPARTAGKTRRYSDDDLDRIRRINELVSRGVNLAGVAYILGLEFDNAVLQADLTRLQADNTVLEADNTRLEADNSRLESDTTRLEVDNTKLQTANAQLETDNTGRKAAGAKSDDGQAER